MAHPAIEISDLRKTYDTGTEALKGVSLEVKEGDFFGLLGANGAGKTTMIGVVPQEFNFNIFEKVQDIIVQQAGYFGIPRRKAMQDSEPILNVLGLSDKRSTQAIKLSGGMKRRLMIARALIHHPKLLILDEPTAGVDVELRHGMWNYLGKLNKEGVTILLTTHYIEEAEALCKNVAIIKEGEIVKNAPVRELIKAMERHVYVAELKDETRVEVVVERGQTLTQVLKDLEKEGKLVVELNPKGNKLEQLFLNIVKR